MYIKKPLGMRLILIWYGRFLSDGKSPGGSPVVHIADAFVNQLPRNNPALFTMALKQG